MQIQNSDQRHSYNQNTKPMSSQKDVYEELRLFLMTNPQQLQPTSRTTDLNNTTIVKREDDVAVHLHATDVLRYKPDGRIILDSGGWRTPTTKDRMNAYLPKGIYVSQENNVWYVHNRNLQIQTMYEDEMVINSDGTFNDSDQTEEEIQQLCRDIKNYAKTFVKEFFEGNIPKPDSGDCWYCSFADKDGKTMGDMGDPTSHLRSHLEEEYYVPSLLANAFKEGVDNGEVPKITGHSLHLMWVEEKSPEEIKDSFHYKSDRAYLQAAIENYFRKRFSLPKTKVSY